MKGIVVFAAVIATALVLSSAAFASSITCVHSSTCTSGNLGGGTNPTSSHGTLPFTGVDLAGVAGLAGLLLVSGGMLYRVGRRRS